MVHQSCSYLKLKGSTYYFSRRVPKSLQKHFKTDRVEVCLHTPQQSSAVRQAQVLASELEDHWYILRRREIKNRLSRVFGDGSDDMRQTGIRWRPRRPSSAHRIPLVSRSGRHRSPGRCLQHDR